MGPCVSLWLHANLRERMIHTETQIADKCWRASRAGIILRDIRTSVVKTANLIYTSSLPIAFISQ